MEGRENSIEYLKIASHLHGVYAVTFDILRENEQIVDLSMLDREFPLYFDDYNLSSLKKHIRYSSIIPRFGILTTISC